jgi:exopolyphosphatase/guanosine-5'-triphosphate,3'-diphosphate pyrophosphatase
MMSPTQPPRRAVIEIKLLVADVIGQEVAPVCEDVVQTRLGRGMYDGGRLQSESIATTVTAIAKLVQRAREQGAVEATIIATSAVRDANNARELTDAVYEATALAVRVLSGDEEASWVFKGVVTDPRLGEKALLIFDVGGGSTELIAGRDRRVELQRSFQLGTVRMLEHLSPPEPPTAQSLDACRRYLRGFVREQVAPWVTPALRRLGPVLAGATGGTINILARMKLVTDEFDRSRVDAMELDLVDLRNATERLWSLPIDERRKIVGLPPERADVMLIGSAIYEALLAELGFERLFISTRGLRFAALIEQ